MLIKSLINANSFINQTLFSQFYLYSLFLIAMVQKGHNQTPDITEEWSLSQDYHALVANFLCIC